MSLFSSRSKLRLFLIFSILSFPLILAFQNCSGSGSANVGNGLADSAPTENFPEGEGEEEEEVAIHLASHGCFSRESGDTSDYHIRGRSDVEGGRAIYHGTQWVPTGDHESFRVVNSFFARDKDNLYDGAGRIITALSQNESLEIQQGGRFAKIPSRSLVVDGGTGLILRVDYSSFETIGRQGLQYFYRDRFTSSQSSVYIQFDSGSEHLGWGYFRYNNGIFYQGVEISGANVTNFQAANNLPSAIARDGANIYFGRNIVASDRGQRLENLSIAPHDYELWSDGEKVFRESAELGSRDEYQNLGEKWYRVGNSVYFRNFEVREVDLDSFQVLNPVYARDDNRIYYNSQAMERYDTATGSLTESMTGIIIDFMSGRYAVIDGQLYIYSRHPISNTQKVDNVDDLECLGNDFFKLGSQIFDSSFEDSTSYFVDLGLNTEELKDYRGDDSVWYDDSGFLNDDGVYVSFDMSQFQSINLNWYYVEGSFHSVSYDPVIAAEEEIDDPGSISRFIRPLSDIQMQDAHALILNDLFVEDWETESIDINTSVVERLSRIIFLFGNGSIRQGQLYAVSDPASYQFLNDILSFDADSVYFAGTEVPGVDPAGGNINLVRGNFWTLGNQVFYSRNELNGALSNDLSFMSNEWVESNGTIFYRANSVTTDVDNFSWIHERGNVWQDATRVGWIHNIYSGVSPSTMTVHRLFDDNPLVIDNGVAWYSGASFSAFNGSGTISVYNHGTNGERGPSFYWTDGTDVFYQYRPLPNSLDYGTFRTSLFSPDYSRDDNQCYLRDNLTSNCRP